MEVSEAVIIMPETPEIPNEKASTKYNDIIELIDNAPITLQKLEEKAQKAQEALEKEEKARKELEALNSKLLAEKTALLDSLSGEKGALQDYQEKCAKLTAQKNDLDNQLRVSRKFKLNN
jgi:DNA repair exonuclease SbcCD ATPase subunit